MLRFLTAGESHGPSLTAILEGMPAGIPVSQEELAAEQARRRWCYGRGGRAGIEKDGIAITGGVADGLTTGAPISVLIPNLDYGNWAGRKVPILRPRPGHADLAGAIKYGFDDCRPVAERSSARETAARVACGYFAKRLLDIVGCHVYGYVTAIGGIEAGLPDPELRMRDPEAALRLAQAAETSSVRCPDAAAASAMIEAIDQAKARGDTLGGTFEVVAVGVPAGLGSYAQWDKRLDARLTAAVMSIGGVKGVEIGEGFSLAGRKGSSAHDAIYPPVRSDLPQPPGRLALTTLTRRTNRAGGIEGGVSNGQIIFVRAAQKPIPTLGSPLPSVDITTGEPYEAHAERSDVCAVGSVAVIAESAVALVIADALLERFGQDRLPAALVTSTVARSAGACGGRPA